MAGYTQRGGAFKGAFLENVVNRANEGYLFRGIAKVDKTETKVSVRRKYNTETHKSEIVGAEFRGGPKVDFNGILRGGQAIGFDTKETADTLGLPLKEIRDNQIMYFRLAVPFGETCFLVVYSSAHDRFYRIHANKVLMYWDRWQANKRKHGYNLIPYKDEDMAEIKPQYGLTLDYLAGLYNNADVLAGSKLSQYLDERAVYAFINRGKGRR